MLKYVLLVIGFILLIKGADFFVEGSSSIAKRLKVPTLIIGMTIVAMGTSLPECAVSISAALQGSNEMAYSNVVGSNIFNLMVVCGACALFTPLVVHKNTLKKEFPFSIIVGIILLIMGFFGMVVGRVDGIILLIVFLFFLVWMVKSALKSRKQTVMAEHKQETMSAATTENAVYGAVSETLHQESGSVSGREEDSALDQKEKTEDSIAQEEEVEDIIVHADEEVADEIKILPVWRCLIYIIGGAIAVAFGGNLVVESATDIATSFGLSQTLIGLTIVAFGTSLPELVTSIVAAKKGDVDMALGNVIGSNIFNILLVLGVASAVSPVAVTGNNLIDAIVLMVMSLIVWGFAWTKKKLVKSEGILMLVMYAAYVVYICMR